MVCGKWWVFVAYRHTRPTLQKDHDPETQDHTGLVSPVTQARSPCIDVRTQSNFFSASSTNSGLSFSRRCAIWSGFRPTFSR